MVSSTSASPPSPASTPIHTALASFTSTASQSSAKAASACHPWQAVLVAYDEVELRTRTSNPKHRGNSNKGKKTTEKQDRGTSGKEWGWDQLHGTIFEPWSSRDRQRILQALWDVLPLLPGCPEAALPTARLQHGSTDDESPDRQLSRALNAQVDAVRNAMLRSGPTEVFSENDAVSKWFTASGRTYEVLLRQMAQHVLGCDALIATHYDVSGESFGIVGATCRPDLFSSVQMKMPEDQHSSSSDVHGIDLDLNDDNDGLVGDQIEGSSEWEWDESDSEQEHIEDGPGEDVDRHVKTNFNGSLAQASSDIGANGAAESQASTKGTSLPSTDRTVRHYLTVTEAKALEVLPDSVLDTIDRDFGSNPEGYHLQALVTESEQVRKVARTGTTRARRSARTKSGKTTAVPTTSRVNVVTRQKSIKFVWRDVETRTSDRLAAQAAAATADEGRTAPPALGTGPAIKGPRRVAALNLSDVVSYCNVFGSNAGILTSVARHAVVLPKTQDAGEKTVLVGSTSGHRESLHADAPNVPRKPTLLEMRLALDLEELREIAELHKCKKGSIGDHTAELGLEHEDGPGQNLESSPGPDEEMDIDWENADPLGDMESDLEEERALERLGDSHPECCSTNSFQ